jgi:hypothetical protein
MKKKYSFRFISMWSQVYLLPTINITYDKYLFGYRNIELWWWKWGVEFLLDDDKFGRV